MMPFGTAIRTCLRKYATFSGRASRAEYWWFFLFGVLGNVLTGAHDGALFRPMAHVMGNGPLSVLFALFILLPSVAAGWRRMHDTGRSGLYLFYPLIVMIGIGMFAGLLPSAGDALGAIGWLVLALAGLVLAISPLLVLWWLTRPGEAGANRFGPAPVQ